MAEPALSVPSLSRRPRVIIFRSAMLARSETFVIEQARSLERWQPILVGERIIPNGLSLEGMQNCLLSPPEGRFGRLSWRFCRSMSFPYFPHLIALRHLRARLLHAHFGFDGVLMAPYAKALGIPLLVTLHGYDINMRPAWWEAGGGGNERRDYPRRLRRLAVQPGVHFLAVSEAIRANAIERGVPREKITVSHIGVDTVRFRPSGVPLSQRPPRILFVGRMVEKKAPLLLVRAFAALRLRLSGAELVMIGDGPLRKEAETLAHQLGAPVRFLGAVPGEVVISELHQARVFCLPSVTTEDGDAEGLPISLLEAQACGVPVVTTAHSGNVEAVRDGETGMIVPERDVGALEKALESVLTSDRLLVMSELATSHVRERFTFQYTAPKLESFYDAVARA